VLIIVLTQLVNWGNQIAVITDTTSEMFSTPIPALCTSSIIKHCRPRNPLHPRRVGGEALQRRHVHLRGADLRFALDLRFAGQHHRVYAYLIQKFILYVATPCRRSSSVSRDPRPEPNRHELPAGTRRRDDLALGWAVASLVTGGLITFMTDQSFLWNQSLGGAAGYAFQNFIGVAVLGVWLIFSTIAAPLIIQHAITHGAQAGAALISGVTSATSTAAAGGFIAAGTSARVAALPARRWPLPAE